MIPDAPPDCLQILSAPLMRQIVTVESGGNPFAIGVVGGRLVRQPRNLPEAVATVQMLEKLGRNYSIGTGQINRVHFSRLGWRDDIARGFDVCTNVRASLGVLQDCYDKARRAGYPTPAASRNTYDAVHAALSCYYSGDLRRGAQLGYVTKVLNAQPAVALQHVPQATPRATSNPPQP